MRIILVFCLLFSLVTGCSEGLNFKERTRLDSLVKVYARHPVNIIDDSDSIYYAYTDFTRKDTAFRLETGGHYLLQDKKGYPDQNGFVLIWLADGCLRIQGYIHYSTLKEFRN